MLHGNRAWEDAEPDLERGWEARREQSTQSWPEARHASRDAWDRLEAWPHDDDDKDVH